MKKPGKIDIIRGKGFAGFEGKIVYASRYVRFNSLNR